MDLKQCPKCGSAAVPDAAFCSKCGHNYTGGAAATMPLAPQAYPGPHFAPPMAMQPPWRCMRCGYAGTGILTKKVSAGGWAVFVILLLFTIIFCWVGLLIKETKIQCPQCGFSV